MATEKTVNSDDNTANTTLSGDDDDMTNDNIVRRSTAIKKDSFLLGCDTM
jgi:hypothetical protein